MLITKKIFFVMGVSGCGKSTIGRLLAKKLNYSFFDGDDFHPEANIKKMKAGTPLNDEDRKGWLEILNSIAKENLADGAVIACSALKESYREILRRDIETYTEFIYLEGTFDQISRRLQKRSGHFMPAGLLQSQFDALEPPEDCIEIELEKSPVEIVDEIITTIQ